MLLLLTLCTYSSSRFDFFAGCFELRSPSLPFWIHKIKFPWPLLSTDKFTTGPSASAEYVTRNLFASRVFQTAVPVNGTNNSRTRLETNKNNTANMGWRRQWLSNSYKNSSRQDTEQSRPQIGILYHGDWWLTSLLNYTEDYFSQILKIFFHERWSIGWIGT